jgi:hypothetical protein
MESFALFPCAFKTLIDLMGYLVSPLLLGTPTLNAASTHMFAKKSDSLKMEEQTQKKRDLSFPKKKNKRGERNYNSNNRRKRKKKEKEKKKKKIVFIRREDFGGHGSLCSVDENLSV